MRLIDANELKKLRDKYIRGEIEFDDEYDLIDRCPTVDAVLTAHGRWDGDTCTACKLSWKYNMVQDADDWGYFDPMPDYCPNCGAKMDGETEGK
jgi:hypothetical protein